MKKQSYHRHSVLLYSRFLSFGTIVFVVGIGFVLIRFVAPEVFMVMASPALRAGDAMGASVKTITSNFSNVQSLIHEKDLLIKQNTILAHENQALTARVQDLTKLIGTSATRTHNTVADVLARPPESPYDTLIVNSGAEDSISVGDSVLAQGGVPVGTIASVSKYFSRVKLFSAPNTTTSAWIGSARTPVILTGSGAGTFTAQLSRQASTTVGDMVYVAGAGIRPIGTVALIGGDAATITETLYIRPFVNPFSITMVEIVP